VRLPFRIAVDTGPLRDSRATPRFSVVTGGLACVASVGVVAALFPQLARYDGRAAVPIAPPETVESVPRAA
jgi:hypothetical protein